MFGGNTFMPFRTLGPGPPEVGMINNKSYIDPPSPPISQHLDENYICNSTHMSKTCRKSEKCVCTHIEYLPLNKVVEFVYYNPDNPNSTLNHPMHHHGVSFQVRGMGTFPDNFVVNECNVRKFHESGMMCSKQKKYPLMDTVPLFAHGYLVYRIYTSNPVGLSLEEPRFMNRSFIPNWNLHGYWLIHCHIDMHMAAGMKFVVHVGTKEDLPPVPKDFPKCGRYLPPIQLCQD
uniref:Plastocyanin-like domain-containing protein n=1 Tax=Timema cristinae TaxID=61476 RepID=A0A7R9H3T0_TIMCR|nr:unnamed protein product [Timema cristinae]